MDHEMIGQSPPCGTHQIKKIIRNVNLWNPRSGQNPGHTQNNKKIGTYWPGF
jgi:hypothetical protein